MMVVTATVSGDKRPLTAVRSGDGCGGCQRSMLGSTRFDSVKPSQLSPQTVQSTR
ncbi:hypothetical protein HanHA89_Chr01g0029921 [Helianthus annuus]|nr:hypothetical protein HanHA89_Chr01g0029921 [Helianthus annuus]